MRRFICLIVLLVFTVSVLPAEENTTPVPYDENEFPQWQRDLRRFEVILIGSFPFTMLYSTLGYGVIRWGINGFSENYAPSLSQQADTVPLTNEEKLGVVFTSVGMSALVAIIDLIVIHVKRNRGNVEDSLDAIDAEE